VWFLVAIAGDGGAAPGNDPGDAGSLADREHIGRKVCGATVFLSHGTPV
jgi:hypothetical protein